MTELENYIKLMVRNIYVLPSTRRPAHPELTPQRPDPYEPPRLRTTRHRSFEYKALKSRACQQKCTVV